MTDVSADARALEAQHLVLKRLLAVGSYGMLQKHLFQRLRPIRTNSFTALLTELEIRGLIVRSEKARHTIRPVALWHITPEGRRVHLEHITALVAKDPEIQDVLEEQRVGQQP